MKRAFGLIIIVAAVIAGFLSIRGAMPFMAVLGNSMEPEFKAGNLIVIEEASVSEIKVGDVIVYTVPTMVREAYNYPAVVAHRVTKIYTTEIGTTFRTKGDNADSEDPFTVRSQDLKGRVGSQIPFVGFPLLFLQSQQGFIFITVGLCLFALYLYAEDLGRGRRKIQTALFAPVIEENHRNSRLLEERIKATEKGMTSTEQALNKFALAIEAYAEHLQSHTSAIQGLSEASQELKEGAAEQNKVLNRLMQVIEQTTSGRDKFVPTSKTRTK